MRKLWSPKNKGVKKSKRKILEQLEVNNQTFLKHCSIAFGVQR